MGKCLYIVKHGVELLDRKCVTPKNPGLFQVVLGYFKLSENYVLRNMIVKFEMVLVARFVEHD